MILPQTDLRQTEEYARYMKMLGWSVQTIGEANLFVKNLLFIGKVAKFQRYPSTINSTSIEQIKASIIYLEPLAENPVHFDRLKNCFLPGRTIQIDLTLSEESLLTGMKQKTRYNIKLANRNKILVTKSEDISAFLELWHKSARTRGMWFPQKKEITALFASFGKNSFLYSASIGDEVLAGLFVIHTKEAAYYMYAASTDNGKEFFAPTLLAWEAIREAKLKGKKIFDFDGIYDPRYGNTKNWKGFTKFKEGFGGEVVTYPGTFVKYINPLLKILSF